jgi:hypothetical protein
MPSCPGYWRNETSGVLAPVVEAYLRQEPLDAGAVTIMRAYLRQWINAGCWDMRGPSIELRALRARVELIATREDIETWIWDALDIGIDPL